MTRKNDIETLARTIYGEARGESTLGKKAIACIVLNRYRAKKWFSGASIAETCLKKWQFSCWNEGDVNRNKLLRATELDLGDCLKIAEDFVDGKEKDFLKGACHYHNVRVYPSWAKGKTADFLIGNHLFYCGID